MVADCALHMLFYTACMYVYLQSNPAALGGAPHIKERTFYLASMEIDDLVA
jgi:hypothetical protein